VEIRDVDMVEPSPPKPQETGLDGHRTMALGAVRRVFKSQQKARGRVPGHTVEDDGGEYSSANNDGINEEHSKALQPHVCKLSHCYTLNMPSRVPLKADTPYVLLG
jgi:hypothetical protein